MTAERKHFVYWMFDADGICLYIGRTKSPWQRWVQHASEKPWISWVAEKRMAGPFTLHTASRLEREQQEEWQPRYDRRQARLRTQYLRSPWQQSDWYWAGILQPWSWKPGDCRGRDIPGIPVDFEDFVEAVA